MKPPRKKSQEAPRSEKFKNLTLLPGYPTYPVSEDIFQNSMEETNINPEDILKSKSPNEHAGTKNEKGFEDDETGGDLDVPGAELDDEAEANGNEDEENNYYSLGGDNHNNLDENG